MLTDETKYKVIIELCYPGTVLDPASVNFNSIVRDRLSIDNQYIEEEVESLLEKIALIKTRLEESPGKNNVKRIGDIELDTGIGLNLIRREYNRLLSNLSTLLDLPCLCKFGSNRNISVCL
jgi:hypothetical protein